MKRTLIEWAHHTVNFWWGCVFAKLVDGSVRQECVHCYAKKLAAFFSRGRATWGKDGKRDIRTEAAGRELHALARTAKRRGVRERVFINSMSDLFEDRPDLNDARQYAFTRFDEVGYALDILLLTKRPENVRRMVPSSWLKDWPLHVWIGTTAGTQQAANEAIPRLLEIPAHRRFVSIEPLLEPIEFEPHWLGGYESCEGTLPPQIHWVIVGGESGAGARPMHPEWVREIRDQCLAFDVPFFFKQWGEWHPTANHFDDLKGRKMTVRLVLDCTHLTRTQRKKVPKYPALQFFPDNQAMARVGKKAAYRRLDGEFWNEVPESPCAANRPR